jgi:surface protein
MFSGAESFNGDVSAWNVDSVTDMGSMFSGAYAFDQDITLWSVSAVTDMNNMFAGADVFNQNLSPWDVTNVVSMNSMFENAQASAAIFCWNDISGATTVDMFLGNIGGSSVRSDCAQCIAGEYRSDPDTCVPCGGGKYLPTPPAGTSGALTCTDCAVGNFLDLTSGATSCTPCEVS